MTLRTERTQQKYKEFLEEGGALDFSDWKNRLIKEYRYWRLIKNWFPYDAVALKNDILITKRIVPFDWNKLNLKEKEELVKIKQSLSEEYDLILENLPKNRSISSHFHLHLLKLKTRFNPKNK